MSEPRFYVVELEGWDFIVTGSGKPTVSCYVLDRFYCHREIARVTQPRNIPGGNPTTERRQAWTREQARRRADELNTWHEAATT